MKDIFDRIKESAGGPLGQYRKKADGYFMFPKLEGEIGPEMTFHGKKVLNWSLNNYLGLANLPEVREADTEGARMWGLAAPMGARMMSGHTKYHEELEKMLGDFIHKPAGYLLNFGYQGMISIIDVLTTVRDVIVYDAEAHACIMDGLRCSAAKRFVYGHNDMDSLRKMLDKAFALAEKQHGGVLVVTEGVYGMAGDLGKLDEMVAIKKEYRAKGLSFRILIDDAHGLGVMGQTGSGTPEHFGCEDEIDVHFCAFAKSMALIGGFVGSDPEIIEHLRFNMRSQIYAKSLPLPIVYGAKKRLQLIVQHPEYRERLWEIANAIQGSLKSEGFNLGNTQSPVTPVYFEAGVNEGTNVVVDLRENYGIFCSIVTYPVVPKGQVMLRIIPTACHTMEHVKRTVEVFKEVKDKLDKGFYNKEMPNMLLQ
ncbi:MAG: pyridoxal phosphate-dependent aminotransferase family protein [Bacteroidales bacterium]|nr:pyridoxal phosphate-dependent aminotransferase family protein [Bacteroidales bacterium]